MKNLAMVIIIISWMFGLTGDELVQKMEDRVTPIDSKVDMVMTLTNKKGKTRSSSLRSITKDDGAKQIIWFLSPADDKGVSFLKIEHDDKDDEMRMWLPAFKKIRRISAKKRSDSFMGSDMSYEDMSTRQLDEFNFKIMGNERFQDVSCHLLESNLILKSWVMKGFRMFPAICLNPNRRNIFAQNIAGILPGLIPHYLSH